VNKLHKGYPKRNGHKKKGTKRLGGDESNGGKVQKEVNCREKRNKDNKCKYVGFGVSVNGKVDVLGVLNIMLKERRITKKEGENRSKVRANGKKIEENIKHKLLDGTRKGGKKKRKEKGKKKGLTIQGKKKRERVVKRSENKHRGCRKVTKNR